MSYCNKCFRLYASEWQSDRCCNAQKRNNNHNYTQHSTQYSNRNSITNNEIIFLKFMAIILLLFINPFLGGFIIFIIFIIFNK
jgi:hypothetical protein